MRILASGLPEVSDCVRCVYELGSLACADMGIKLACALPLDLSTDISKLPPVTSCGGEVGLCGTEG